MAGISPSTPAAVRRRLASGGPGDRGDIILGWLTRIAIVIGVLGIALFDAISIGTTAMNVSDDGDYAARQASEKWQATHSIQDAYDAAVEAATEQNPTNVIATKDFVVDRDGRVHLTISRDATTLVVFRFSATKKWAHVSRRSEGMSVA